MGLFDTVFCHVQLPDSEVQNCTFQTKSLACLMESYTITRAGRLVKHERLGEFRKDPDAPLGGSIETTAAWDEDTGFHGDLDFYEWYQDAWYEYRAHFIDGQLHGIERLVPETAHGPAERGTTARSRRYAHSRRRWRCSAMQIGHVGGCGCPTSRWRAGRP